MERSFRERDPGLFFVLPRVLRRVLRNELEITSPWVRLPHRKSYVIPRERLLWLVEVDELGIESTAQVPDRAILLARPEEDRLQAFEPSSLARYYWRLVYHAKIDAVMGERTSERHMTPAELRYRIDRIGQEQFDEIRAVLKQENFLTHPENPRHVYAEFVAVFAELQAFAPELTRLYFPALVDLAAVERQLREDCDLSRLLEACRPIELAPEQTASASLATARHSVAEPQPLTAAPNKPSAWRYRWYQRRAARLNERGNTMRAIVMRQRAQRYAPAANRDETDQLLAGDLDHFAGRLQTALELTDDETTRFREVCRQLLTYASDGYWNANARLLYDLQKVCNDFEKEAYRVDLWRWLKTWGRTPLKRPLPDLKLVLIAKHLRTATRRIAAVRLGPEHRVELEQLLHHVAERAEDRLRALLEPQITTALEAAGMVPTCVIERVALRKLTAELSDGVVERGFVTLGHLRDAVARGTLKLPDLTTLQEFARGDLLLRADRQLAAELDGVYQRGPFYLRWLQRMTSLFFGTPTGRIITLYFALPFGMSYVGLMGVQLLSYEAAHFLHTPKLHVYSHGLMAGLGLVLLALIHSAVIRQGAWLVVRSSWLLLRGMVIDLPRWLYRFPGVPWLLRSLPALVFRRYLFSPLAATLLLWKGLPTLGWYSEPNVWLGLAILVATFLALNSRMGRNSEELFWEWLGRTWYRFRVTVIIGLFNLIVDLFRQIMDGIERVLYGVDEWLRFRSGDSQWSLGVKAVLGLVWSFVQGIIRFCVTLLIEPQVNPIKHFPVVTVSHKLIFPTFYYISLPFEAFTDPITAKAIGTTIVTVIPGVFGFLAWELKENWRVYAANRARTLKPVLVGHHGETVLRLLKPGFHSGTIPKLFARRRRVARKSRHHAEWSRHSKYDEKLHHEALALQHFVEREFLGLLQQSRRLRDLPLEVRGVDLSTNRLAVRIGREGQADELRLTFAEQSGWLIAGMHAAGWTRALDPDQKRVLTTALAGLYHLAAVDLVREQLERQLGTPPHPYDIGETGLVIWTTRSYDTEIHYPLAERPNIAPRPRSLARTAGLDTLPATALVFREHPLDWTAWRDFWEAEAHADVCPNALLPNVTLLRA